MKLLNNKIIVQNNRFLSLVVIIILLLEVHCLKWTPFNNVLDLGGPDNANPIVPAPAGTVSIGTIGDDQPMTIQLASNNGFLIGGSFVSTEIPHAHPGLILKTDSHGALQWRKELDSLFEVSSLIAIQGDSLLLAGRQNNGFSILRTDAFCNVVWKRCIAAISPEQWHGSISAALSIRGLFIAGETDTGSGAIPTLWAQAIDADGNMTFSKENIVSQVAPSSLSIINIDTNYFIFYEKATNQYNNNYITKMMRLGKYGDIQLDTPVTFLNGHTNGKIIKVTSDNNLLLFGGYPPLQKIDREGNVIWGISISLGYYVTDVVEVSTGGFLFVGWTRTNTGNQNDVWISKVNANGDSLWSYQYGGHNNDVGKAIVETPDGGFAIVAETHSYGSGGSDIWLFKIDTNGKLQAL